jgi:hypothetical protein
MAAVTKITETAGLSKKMGTKGRHYRPIHQTLQVVGQGGFLLESGAESSMVCPREIHLSHDRYA